MAESNSSCKRRKTTHRIASRQHRHRHRHVNQHHQHNSQSRHRHHNHHQHSHCPYLRNGDSQRHCHSRRRYRHQLICSIAGLRLLARSSCIVFSIEPIVMTTYTLLGHLRCWHWRGRRRLWWGWSIIHIYHMAWWTWWSWWCWWWWWCRCCRCALLLHELSSVSCPPWVVLHDQEAPELVSISDTIPHHFQDVVTSSSRVIIQCDRRLTRVRKALENSSITIVLDTTTSLKLVVRRARAKHVSKPQ